MLSHTDTDANTDISVPGIGFGIALLRLVFTVQPTHTTVTSKRILAERKHLKLLICAPREKLR